LTSRPGVADVFGLVRLYTLLRHPGLITSFIAPCFSPAPRSSVWPGRDETIVSVGRDSAVAGRAGRSSSPSALAPPLARTLPLARDIAPADR
jgi:hypothetical protein